MNEISASLVAGLTALAYGTLALAAIMLVVFGAGLWACVRFGKMSVAAGEDGPLVWSFVVGAFCIAVVLGTLYFAMREIVFLVDPVGYLATITVCA